MTDRAAESKKFWEDLIEAEAIEIADRENEAESHCGAYGTSTADDYRNDTRIKFEEIGQAYLKYLISSDKLEIAGDKLVSEGSHYGWFKQQAKMADLKTSDPIGYSEFMGTVERVFYSIIEEASLVNNINSYLRYMDEDGYVPFNADRSLGQNQYASRYVHGRIEPYPNLGEGLRWKNRDSGNYHSILIHRDDLNEFHRRVRAYRQINGVY